MKLGLGTVQFGLDYGATNRSGRVPEEEVRTILARAAQAGVGLLDTAAAYGDAEAVLGRCLPRPHPFAIVTKTLPARSPDEIARGFASSLERLGTSAVWGLLGHRADDLLAPDDGPALARWLLAQRESGRATRVGVSVYSPEEADELFARYPFDLVQLPMNVFDQRFIAAGTLDRLLERGVEIHIRSAFLQGILLTTRADLPPRLAALAPALTQYHEALERARVAPLAAALGFLAQACPEATILCGVTGVRELAEILAASQHPPDALPDLGPFACNDNPLIDPRRWTS